MKKFLTCLCVILAITVLGGCQKAEEKAVPPPAPTVAPAPAHAPEQKPAEVPKTEAPEPKTVKQKTAVKEKKAEPAPVKEQKLARIVPPPSVPEKKSLPQAPSFVLNDIHGNRISLSDFRGKVVALEFSAVWCPPCLKSAQNLRGLYDRYRNRGFEIVMIFLADQPSTAESANNIVRKYGLPYTILLDDRNVSKAYGITAMPTFFAIDRGGRIAGRKLGTRSEEELARDIEALF